MIIAANGLGATLAATVLGCKTAIANDRPDRIAQLIDSQALSGGAIMD